MNTVDPNDFAGTWKLADSYSETPDGRTPLPLGEQVSGRISYDTAGNMAAQLMAGGRQGFSSNVPDQIPAEEYRAAFQTYTAYFGTYTIDAAAGTVTHAVEGAIYPGWCGGEQLRYFTLEGDTLTLKTPPMRNNEGIKCVHTLVWKRVV